MKAVVLALGAAVAILAAGVSSAAPAVGETGRITTDDSRTTTGCVSQAALEAATKAVAARDREGFKELFGQGLCIIMPNGAEIRVLEVNGWVAPTYKIRLFHNGENVVLWTVREAIGD